MKRFIVTGHLASTAGNFSLNDLPGAGRMDVLCRCVNASFFLSHDFRRDVECYLVLCGEPEPPKTVMFSGEKVRYLSPDERSAGSLIKKPWHYRHAVNSGSRLRGSMSEKGAWDRCSTSLNVLSLPNQDRISDLQKTFPKRTS